MSEDKVNELTIKLQEIINRDIREENTMSEYKKQAIEKVADEISVFLDALRASLNPNQPFEYSTSEMIGYIEESSSRLSQINATTFEPRLFE
jgi:molecular chaperone GrpE (heat shock protein)